jgi:endoglucanase
LGDHIKNIKAYGFNAVRLTLNSMVMLDPDSQIPQNFGEGQNPEMKGKSVGHHLDNVVKLCAESGILVMMNFYSFKPAAGIAKLWYSPEFPEDEMLKAWQSITKRYKNSPNVFAMDIKNEPHGKEGVSGSATWGDGGPTDFAKWCETCGDAILEINPNILICADGIEYMRWGDDVSGAIKRPVKLKIKDKVFYSPHIYQLDPAWMVNSPTKTFEAYLDKIMGDAVASGLTVVIGEYGYATDPAVIEKDKGDDMYYSVDSQLKYMTDLTKYCNTKKIVNAFYWELVHNAAMGLSIYGRTADGRAIDNKLTLIPGKLENIMKLQTKVTNLTF